MNTRVRVERRRQSPRSNLAITREIDEQTVLGSAVLRSLIRAQLRLAIGVIGFLAVTLGAVPVVFHLAPSLTRAHIAGVSLPWMLLGFLAYPLFVGLGWYFVRHAERNERAFTRVVHQGPIEHAAVQHGAVQHGAVRHGDQ